MRPLKSNETRKNRRGGTVEYYDELNRNTYYYNPYSLTYYDKLWIRLPNGEDRETYVEGASYWRRHNYNIHTFILESEIDSKGKTNLLHHRQKYNPKDTQLSQETLNQGTLKTQGSIALF